jgi:hypothetical protein
MGEVHGIGAGQGRGRGMGPSVRGGEKSVASDYLGWYGRVVGGVVKGTSVNTGLPASLLAALVASPNLCAVTPFAEGRKRCASTSGSATRNVM